MLAPVYLLPEIHTGVSLDDKTLVVRRENAARQLVPLNRVSRIVTSETVSWGQDALLACLQHGVPVFFLNKRGQFTGACYGTRRRESTLGNLLAVAVDLTDWSDDVNTWFAGKHQAECLAMLKETGLRGDATDLAGAHGRAVNCLHKSWGRPPAKFLRAWLALQRPWVEEQLLDFLGGGYEYLAWQTEGIHLGERFCELMNWHALALIRASRHMPPQSKGVELWAVHAFEASSPLLSRKLGELIGSFERWLRELA